MRKTVRVFGQARFGFSIRLVTRDARPECDQSEIDVSAIDI